MDKKRKKYTKVNIGIYEKDVFAEYGYDNHELIEESLVYTVYSLAETKPIKENLELSFTKKVDAEFDENRFKTAYKNTITSKIKSLNLELRRCFLIGLLLLLAGVSVLCVDVFLIGDVSEFLYEFINIMAWVFWWAVIEVMTIHAVQIIIEKRKYIRLLNCKISFKN